MEAQRALDTDETPVSCVIVHDGNIIARGMNATNRTMNGTRHAEFQAIASILSDKPLPAAETPNIVPRTDPSRPRYSVDVLKECDLYVTVEPCIMCASLLRQYGIRKVYFGAANDRFGGAGGVMDIHSCEAVDPPYPVSGGWLREEAIMLLRRFYIQTNINGKQALMKASGRRANSDAAPQPINKKERVLKEEVAPAGTPVNRIVTSVELALQKAQEKLAKTAAAKQPEGL